VAKRANDECYRYMEKFTPDHKCTSKGVFLLEMDDDSEPDTIANELGISLDALTGIDIANTMKLQVRIKGTTRWWIQVPHTPSSRRASYCSSGCW
jgi:hypothetical protein